LEWEGFQYLKCDFSQITRRLRDMNNWTFGITMVIVGMGGTLLTLWILSLIMSVLKKVFPYKKEEEGK
jgi:hypothetical protein